MITNEQELDHITKYQLKLIAEGFKALMTWNTRRRDRALRHTRHNLSRFVQLHAGGSEA